jgi:hypothetical protein
MPSACWGGFSATLPGRGWLAAFNSLPLYFTPVAVIQVMLAVWFFWMAGQARSELNSTSYVPGDGWSALRLAIR